MGLSIHYKGKFNKKAVLADLINDVIEIAETFQWPYKVYLTDFPQQNVPEESIDGKIYGISFTPPGCEPLAITFLSNYGMSCNVNLELYKHCENQHYQEFLYMLSVKTQSAGVDIHKTIIALFHYLSGRDYFSEFDLIDEGEYWDTCDEEVLERKFQEYENLINKYSLAIEASPVKQGELYDSYFERIIKMIADRR